MRRGWAGALQAAAGWIAAVARSAAATAALLVAVLAVLTVVLVVARYCFGWNHTGWEEFKWHCFGAAVMLGGAWCLERDGHVRMDLVYARLPPRGKAAIDLAAMLVVVVPFCLVVAYYGTTGALDSFERGEISRNAGGLPHRWIIRSTIPLGFALLGLQAVAVAMRSLVVVVGGVQVDTGDDPPEADDG